MVGSLDIDGWNTIRANPSSERLLDRFLVLHIPATSDGDVRSTLAPVIKVFSTSPPFDFLSILLLNKFVHRVSY